MTKKQPQTQLVGKIFAFSLPTTNNTYHLLHDEESFIKRVMHEVPVCTCIDGVNIAGDYIIHIENSDANATDEEIAEQITKIAKEIGYVEPKKRKTAHIVSAQ